CNCGFTRTCCCKRPKGRRRAVGGGDGQDDGPRGAERCGLKRMPKVVRSEHPSPTPPFSSARDGTVRLFDPSVPPSPNDCSFARSERPESTFSGPRGSPPRRRRLGRKAGLASTRGIRPEQASIEVPTEHREEGGLRSFEAALGGRSGQIAVVRRRLGERVKSTVR